MKSICIVDSGRPLQLLEIAMPSFGLSDVLVRVKAAGICHSDAHYRAGVSPVINFPLPLGHEVAGVIEEVGESVVHLSPGDRVCLHYLVTCGMCHHCQAGREQFCPDVEIIGKHRPGGYAEYIVVPAHNAYKLPEKITFEEGAILMCSSSTAYHALRKSRLQSGEMVAVFGIGGLGLSAVQLAKAMGAETVYAVDLNRDKLDLARKFGAIPIHPDDGDPVEQIVNLTGGKGVEVAVELIGLAETIQQALNVLGVQGRLAVVGLMNNDVPLDLYGQVINKEAEIIGVSDHLASEIPQLIEYAASGQLDLQSVITGTIALDADLANNTLDSLDNFSSRGRVVIRP